MQNYIRRVRVTDLFEDKRNLIVDFDKDLNCIYGYNGTGKTVLIDLIVNSLEVNIEQLSRSPFHTLTILTSSSKQPEKFFTVYNDYNGVYYEFHKDIDTGYVRHVSKNDNKTISLRKRLVIKKGVKYLVRTKDDWSFISRRLSDDNIKKIDRENARNGIKSQMAITYVPLLRINENQDKSSLDFGMSISPSSSFLIKIQEEFSKQYAAAQSNIARKLESLSSNILESLFVNQTDTDMSSYQNKVDDFLRKGKIENTGMAINEVINQIRDLKLNIPEAKIQEHFRSWAKVQTDLISAHKAMKSLDGKAYKKDKAENEQMLNEHHEIINSYTKAYFSYITSLGMYKKLQVAISQVNVVYYEKSLHMKKFEDFKKAINEFLSDSKVFTFDDDGTFKFTHSDRDVKLEHLSSGEKHLIAILGHLCTSDESSYVFIADEPELSLHLEWQRKILPIIKELSPDTQVIVATHSPAIISKDSNRIDIEECYTYA